MEEFIISFINCDNDDKLKKRRPSTWFDNNSFFLLVLDNIEEVIYRDIGPLKIFLARLDQEC